MPPLTLFCYHWPLALASSAASAPLPEPTAAVSGGWTVLMGLAGLIVIVAALALVYAVARRRMVDVKPLSLEDVGELRKIYLVLLTIYFGVAIYGSLVPLQVRHVAWDTAVEQFRNIRYLQLDEVSRADWVANILLFIPLAYLATAVLTLGVRSWLVRLAAVVVVAGSCAALSAAIEFTQIWFWPRTVSLNDIVAESIGGLIGSLLWLLLGTTIHGWLSAYLTPQRRRTQIDQLLEFYLVGLVIYSLLPLDLTISPAELYHKFRDGKIVRIPFSDFYWNVKLAYSVLTDIVTFIPVGMYSATAFTSQQKPVRGLLASTLLGAGIAALIELAQLFVIEHFTSATTVAVAAVGCCIGAALMRRFRSARWGETAAFWSEETARRAASICVALMGLYALVLLAVFCSGGVWETDAARLSRRFHGFWRPPLAALYWGREYNALSDVLRKVLFFVPLGALGAVAAWGMTASKPRRRLLFFAVLLYAAIVSFSIEMLQVYLPPPKGDPSGPMHVADVGDVLVCTAGAALGLLLTWRVLSAPQHFPRREELRIEHHRDTEGTEKGE
ncbi:MAG: VanZ family protein [Planctomycetes bacterium]|nr:VanZ family protein [Planctomycetota bacterium]